jgi:hypothetical protein
MMSSAEPVACLSAASDLAIANGVVSAPGVTEANGIEPRKTNPALREQADISAKAPVTSVTSSPSAVPVTVADRESTDPNFPGESAPHGKQAAAPPDQPSRTPAAPAQGLPSDPNVSTVMVLPDPNSGNANTKSETTTELVGFLVRGRWLSERLQVDDLDSLVTPDGKRWLPVLRILRVFHFRVEEQASVIRFTVEGVGDVELDLEKKEVRIKDQMSPIELLQAVSEITMKADIYVSPEDLSKILDMELVWNAELYAYLIQLDRKLSIWDFSSGKSLLAMRSKYVEMDLPEALPSANRSREPLQLVEVDWHPSYSLQGSTSGQSKTGSDSHVVNINGPRETFWGNLDNGQYKVQVSHPSLMWASQQGWRWSSDDPYLAHADWFEWTYRLPSAEVTVGDSAFGLSDLVYPVFNATGVRINGLTGWTSEELKTDRSGMGMRQYFGRTHVFEGPAPIGATAELLVNGRTIDVQKVSAQADSPPGMGTYRFEGIELPNGILNEITILIKESNGNEIRVEKSVMGTPQLVPQGRAAYLGIVGSKRDSSLLGKRALDAGDFYGYVTGGRVLYGLTDRLTIGTTLASEQDYNHLFLAEGNTGNTVGGRSYPKSSNQAGAMLSYLPVDNLMLSGDVAGSQAEEGEGQGRYSDMAARMRAQYVPTQTLTLDADFLNLQPSYFDGVDPEVADRRGGEVGLAWNLHRKWTLEGGIGEVGNNLNGQLDHTTVVDYQNIGVMTTVLPRTTLTAKLHHLDVSAEEDSRMLTEFGLNFMPARDLSLYGRVLLGKELTVEEDDRFLSLLRLRHAPQHLSPSQYWAIRKTLNSSNTVGLIYSDTKVEQTLSFVHDLRVPLENHPLLLHTEFIKELMGEPDGGEYGFRGRCEYLFDRVGYNSLGASAEYLHGAYSFFLYLNMRNLYSHHDGRFTNINESRVRPDYGAVHGKVFLDYNGNHLLDANEPGVPNVKVSLGETTSAVTDKNGYYILPASSDASEVRVYLDGSTVPAMYTVTHGTQLAKVYRDSLTEVNLSLAPLISITGRIVVVDPNAAHAKAADPNAPDFTAMVLDVADPNKVRKPVSSVRVSLSDPESNRLVTGSVTAEDGSYYLSDVKPGKYVLRVDAKTLPKSHEITEQERTIEVKPTREEFMEIQLPDFVATIRNEAEQPGDLPVDGKDEEDLKAAPEQKP